MYKLASITFSMIYKKQLTSSDRYTDSSDSVWEDLRAYNPRYGSPREFKIHGKQINHNHCNVTLSSWCC